MATSDKVHIVDYSAVTSAGATTAVALAAWRLGFSRTSLEPAGAGEEDEDTFVTNVARVIPLTTKTSGERAWQLLELAIEQVAGVLDKKNPVERVWVAAPLALGAGAKVRSLLESKLGAQKGDFVIPVGGGGSLEAVEQAFRAIESGRIDVALVAGVDVRTQPKALIQKADRTIGPDRSFGFVPGEAAAVLVLASDSAMRRSRWASAGRLLAVCVRQETCPYGSAKQCTGVGLTQAIQEALTVLPSDGSVAEVFCNLNGERWQTDEWGFAVPRIASSMRDAGSFKTSTGVFGDCGAVDGLLLMALAASAGQKGFESGRHALIWTISDDAARTAVVVEGERLPKPLVRPEPVNLPGWADELDRGQLDLFADECAFRYDQRLYLIGQSEQERWQDWGSLEYNEYITDDIVAGLVESGARGKQAVKTRFKLDEPGSVYAAIRVFLEQGDLEGTCGLVRAVENARPASGDAALYAFRQARTSFEDAKCCAEGLISAGSCLGVEMAASRSFALPIETLVSLGPNVPSARDISFIRTLGLIGKADVVPLLPRWLESPESPVRLQAALTYLLIMGKNAARYILTRAQDDSAFLIPAALIAEPHQNRLLLTQAASKRESYAIWAMALIGTASVHAPLLECLSDESTAIDAAHALELILGIAPLAQDHGPQEDVDAAAERPLRVSTQPTDWQPHCSYVAARHSSDTRLRGGMPATKQSTLALLNRPSLSSLARTLIAYELALRWGIRPLFDPWSFLREQSQWFSRYGS